jgi:hypothetical protein
MQTVDCWLGLVYSIVDALIPAIVSFQRTVCLCCNNQHRPLKWCLVLEHPQEQRISINQTKRKSSSWKPKEQKVDRYVGQKFLSVRRVVAVTVRNHRWFAVIRWAKGKCKVVPSMGVKSKDNAHTEAVNQASSPHWRIFPFRISAKKDISWGPTVVTTVTRRIYNYKAARWKKTCPMMTSTNRLTGRFSDPKLILSTLSTRKPENVICGRRWQTIDDEKRVVDHLTLHKLKQM